MPAVAVTLACPEALVLAVPALSVAVAPLFKTGASLHHVDNGIDSGEVIHDVLGTHIDPEDSILELRWNNFNHSLFPALHQGLALLASRRSTEGTP